MTIIRDMRPGDEPILAALYRDSVTGLGPTFYSPDQVRAWASFSEEGEAFEEFVAIPRTIVAEDETGPVGFAGLEEDGHVVSLYVRSDRARRGVGARLLEAVLEQARARGIPRLYAEASLFSRPVFESHGFHCERTERVERRGALFERFRMVRD